MKEAKKIKKVVKEFIKWTSYELWSSPFSRYITPTKDTEELYFQWDYEGDMPEGEVVECINQAKKAIVKDIENKSEEVILGHSKTKIIINEKLTGYYYLGAGGTGGGQGCGPTGCM